MPYIQIVGLHSGMFGSFNSFRTCCGHRRARRRRPLGNPVRTPPVPNCEITVPNCELASAAIIPSPLLSRRSSSLPTSPPLLLLSSPTHLGENLPPIVGIAATPRLALYPHPQSTPVGPKPPALPFKRRKKEEEGMGALWSPQGAPPCYVYPKNSTNNVF